MRFRLPFQASKPPYIPLFQGVNSYTIYYGNPTYPILSKLKAYDLIMIEPHLFQAGQIAELQESGTSVLGYISVMETPTWNAERYHRLKDSDFFIRNNKRIHFTEWDSYLMDLTQSHYQNLLIDEIEKQIIAKGCNGILFDTVGDMDDHMTEPLIQQAMKEAYTYFVKLVKTAYPRLALVQNRGFSTIDVVLPWIDGFLWEDWHGSWKQSGWMVPRVRAIRRAQEKGLFVFSVSMERLPLHQNEAEKLGFVHAVKDDGYQAL